MSWKDVIGKNELTESERAEFHKFMVNGNYTPEECKQIYNKWAPLYDTVSGGLHGPKAIAEKCDGLFDEKDKSEKRILDVGAGTGLVGVYLKDKGFPNIDALDPSDGMLTVAKQKNVYTNFICEFLGPKPLDISNDTYDILTSSGTLVAGHVQPEGFEEMCRLVKRGGYIVFAMADEYLTVEKMNSSAFFKILEEYEKTKKWKVSSIDKLELYISSDRDKPGKVYTLEVL